MAREKILHLRALGAEVRITRSDVGKGHPDYYQDMAERLAREIRAPSTSISSPIRPIRWRMRQTTGPEIWEQMDHDVDAIVVGVGSGGTLTGLGRFFAQACRRRREMVLADPEGSILRRYVRTGKTVEAGSWAVEGIGEDFIPPNRRSVAASSAPMRSPTTKASKRRARCCAKEGILGGSSSGTLLAAALRYCREQTTPKRVVTLVPRQRQQISLEDLQRLLDDRAGPGRARAAWRSARSDRAALRRRRHGHGRRRTIRC